MPIFGFASVLPMVTERPAASVPHRAVAAAVMATVSRQVA